MHRFSLLTTTLLLCLTPTIQLDRTSLAIVNASAQAQTPQNRKDEADRLYGLGTQQLNKGQYREALQPLEQALGIYRAIGDHKGESLALNNIGRVYSNRGDNTQALKYYEQALIIRKEVNDRVGEGLTLNNIGLVYSDLGDYPQALKYYQQALAIIKQENHKAGEGIILSNLGIVYSKLGQYSDALKTYQQALVIRKQVNDKAGEGVTLNNIGLIYSYQGDYPQALKHYQQALVIFKEVGDKAGEGITLSNMGAIYNQQGQYPDALKYYQQALVIHQQIGDKSGEGTTLNNMGLVYTNLGDYPQALKHYQQTLIIFKEVGNKAGEGITLSNIGQVYSYRGQYPDALNSYEQALVIAKQVGNKAGEGTILNNLGEVYHSLGQHDRAMKTYQQALAIRQQIGDKEGEGTTLNNLGAVYDNLGRYAEALKTHQQALAIFQQIGDKASEGNSLNNIGVVYTKLGQYSEALKYHQQALVIRQQVGDKAGEGTTLNNIGIIYDNLGQYDQGLKSYQQALMIYQQVGDKVGEGIALNNIGYVYKVLGQYAEAEKNLFAAMKIAESVRPGLSDEHKVSIFERQAHTYRLLQQALVAQNKINTALEIAERGRARAFVELMAQRQSTTPNTQVPVQSLSLSEIQSIAKQQNATLVEYSIVQDAFKNQGKVEWRDSELYIWVVKPTGEVAFKQVDLKSLKIPLANLVTTSRDSIGVRGRGLGAVARIDTVNEAEHLQQLHKLLIEPIAQLLPTNPSDRVIFIPQNELFLVPFPALKDASGKYLIEKHTILTAPAIQVLELTRKQRATRVLNRNSRMNNGADALIVGNPTMPLISPQNGEPPQQLANLPGAEQEAHAIAQLFNTKAITGQDATKSAIVPQMTKARIIHLATHGLLDDFKGLGVPGALAERLPGSIALAPSGKDDGLLTSSEIFDMKLNAELVVLSACDTGRGTITGDGVIGLSRSLITAGVPSVVVSLWSVPDAPTASLMTEFYRQLQQNPDKATALRQAMLTTMKQHPNPKNWAAFTLIGEAE